MCQKPLLGHLLPSVFTVCNKMTKYRAISPFLCMDMTYITCLLKEGFGFKDSTVLQVRKCPSPPCFTRPHRDIFNTFGEELLPSGRW